MSTPGFHRFRHTAMNTFFEVIVAGGDPDRARQMSAAAFREVDRVEALLSRFNAGSNIGQINLLKSGEVVRVAPETMDCLLQALWVWQETGGAFDVTVGALVECYRTKEGDRLLPDESMIARSRDRVGMEKLTLTPGRFEVGVTRDNIEVDLGAIGKGYALDKAAEVLEEWDVSGALIHSGTSSVLALGVGDRPDGWGVGVCGDWGARAGIETLTLRNESLSGSGTEVQGRHILDPRTGRPSDGHLAAWATSPSAAIADGLSTAFMVMKADEIRNFCADHEGMEAYVVDQDGTVIHIGGRT